jgi:acetylornithine deacetylase
VDEVLGVAAVTGLLAQLVRIPSVNPTLAPDEGEGERALAEFTCVWLSRHGLSSWMEEVAPGRMNTVARTGSGSGPTLVLCGHLDTVGTAGMTIPPFEPRCEGGRLFGRGSSDMKGGVAAVMTAAAALAAEGPRGNLLVALVCDEEYASIGAEAFAARHLADGCVITEPTGGGIVLAHKGFAWAEVRTRGVAAHGSRWDLGESAITRMGSVIGALDLFDREILRERRAELVGPASLHPALIEGGVGLSTYAPECTLKVERRTLPGEELEEVRRELEEVVRAADPQAELTVPFYRNPMRCNSDEPVVRALTAAAEADAGSPPMAAGVGYWTDAAVFADAGIPTLLYGPAGEGAHAAVEWVDLDSVAACARVLVDTARRFWQI